MMQMNKIMRIAEQPVRPIMQMNKPLSRHIASPQGDRKGPLEPNWVRLLIVREAVALGEGDLVRDPSPLPCQPRCKSGGEREMNKQIRLAEQPARPIHRRWPRYIGPHGWPEYFVKGHYRAQNDGRTN